MNKVKEMLEALEKELRQNKQYSAADKLLPIIQEADVSDTNVGKWIPYSERLPEESDTYLCTTYNGNLMDLPYSSKHQAFNAFDGEAEPQHKIDVIAWQPLPAPYREARHDT